jgi:hypothetical protein
MTTGLVRSRESRSKRLRPSPGPSCRPLSPHRSGVAHCLWSSRWRCCWWVPVYSGTFSDANPRLRGPSATSFLLSNLGQRLAQGASPSIAISPDGTHVAYTAGQGADTQLYLRAQDAFDARPMPGTEGAEGPFFSPDGQWVAFYSKSTLFKLFRSTEGNQRRSATPRGVSSVPVGDPMTRLSSERLRKLVYGAAPRVEDLRRL